GRKLIAKFVINSNQFLPKIEYATGWKEKRTVRIWQRQLVEDVRDIGSGKRAPVGLGNGRSRHATRIRNRTVTNRLRKDSLALVCVRNGRRETRIDDHPSNLFREEKEGVVLIKIGTALAKMRERQRSANCAAEIVVSERRSLGLSIT